MTGYMGRTGLYEIFTMSPALRKLVTDTTDMAALRDQAYKEGLRPLRISGATKVAAGITTIEEVFKVAPPVLTENKPKAILPSEPTLPSES